ncbi:MAG: glycosyltransferase family 4 protein [Verrucomicrobiota bacterium]
MRILFTNNTLADYAGTEIYTRDVALGMQARGHQPLAFTLEPGRVANELEQAGVPVFNDLNAIPNELRPDLIHGHHFFETSLAALAFPKTPVLSFCHGPVAWQETPCRLPNVVTWITVDHRCRDRLIDEESIPADRIETVFNFIDTDRFQPRATPLPRRPEKALVFSNTMADCDALRAAQEACAQRNLPLDVVGLKAGSATDTPESILPQYDLVFAKAKAAIEAMAVGCAVIQLDYFGAGELITPDSFDRLRTVNFGYAAMQTPPTADHIGIQIDKYDPAQAQAVTDRIRNEASIDDALDQLEELYRQSVTADIPSFDPVNAGSDFLRLQSLIARKYLATVKSEDKKSFQLPPPPLPAHTNLRTYLEDFLSHHQHPEERIDEWREKSKQLRARLDKERQRNKNLTASLKESQNPPPPKKLSRRLKNLFRSRNTPSS